MLKFSELEVRNIKTTISIFICILIISNILKMQCFYAVIAAVSCLQPSVKNVYKVGIDRSIGTIFGGVIGLVFLYFWGENSNDIFRTFSMTMAVTFVMWGSVKLTRRPDSWTISAIVFLAVTTNLLGRDPYEWAGNRILTTIFGVLVAMGVNYIFEKYEKTS